MATLVRAQKALIKQMIIIVIIVTGKTPNYKSQIYLSPEKLAKLYDGRIVTSVQIFCMCISQQNVILFHYRKEKQHLKASVSSSFGSSLARDLTRF